MAQSISREAALRVALAARELGSLPVRGLVSALVERLELPLTEAKLATVTVADLQLVLQGDEVIESAVPREQLKQAVRLLWGEGIANRDLPLCSDKFVSEVNLRVREYSLSAVERQTTIGPNDEQNVGLIGHRSTNAMSMCRQKS